MQALPQTSGHFPHRMVQDPRGFLLPRFVNAGRHQKTANVAPRPASKNLQGTGPSLHFAPMSAERDKAVVLCGCTTRCDFVDSTSIGGPGCRNSPHPSPMPAMRNEVAYHTLARVVFELFVTCQEWLQGSGIYRSRYVCTCLRLRPLTHLLV